MKLASTVVYVDSVQPVLDFYRRAFGIATRFVDLDVQLPGRQPASAYEFAILEVAGGELHFATHALGELLMPGYQRPSGGQPSGVEIVFFVADVPAAFERAVEAGAVALREPREMPWGQTAAYVRSSEGMFVGLCSPLPGESSG